MAGTATGWVHTPLGSYRTGPGWQAPPIPPGRYNPIRDVEIAEGKRGTLQSENALSRQHGEAESNYGIGLSQLEARERDEKAGYQRGLENLASSYQRLGARQGDQANAAGTLYGGALIAAKAKRAANEGRERQAAEARQGEAQEGFGNERGRLLLTREREIGPGGSLTEALANAGLNEHGFEEGIGTLKATEAANRGYQAPTGPYTGRFPKVNPLSGARYREYKQGKRTVHEYEGGRKVTV